MKKLITISMLLLSTTFSQLLADSRLSPIFMGGCQSNGMILRGLDAVAYNPALLSFSDNYRYSINLFPINFSFESSVPRNIYDDYFSENGDNSWSTADQDKMLDLIGDGLALNVNAKSSIVGLQINNQAFALNIYNHLNAFIPDDFWDFALRGNDFNKSYKFDETNVEIYNLASTEYTYSDKFNIPIINNYVEEFTVGATVRYMYGFPIAKMGDDAFIDLGDDNKDINLAFMKIDNVQSELLVSNVSDINSPSHGATKLKMSYDVLVSEAGHGFGMDVGVAAKINDNMSCGFSINNLISGINWSKNNKIYRYQKILDGIYPQNTQDTSQDSIWTNTATRILDTLETDKFTTSIPAELNLGFAWKFNFAENHDLIWTSGYSQQFSEEGGATITPKLTTGLEYAPVSWFKVRSGIMIGGTAGFGSAAGFGFYGSNYAFDFGIEDKYFFGKNSKGVGISIGQKIFW